MSISRNIARIRQDIPPHVTLLCVSKFHTEEAIREAYQAGERNFGESRVQELLRKAETLPKDIRWHFIGHLQTNKVKQALSVVSLIHGIDSFRLLEAVSRGAIRPVDVLLEVHIAQEESKQGFSAQELEDMLEAGLWKRLPNVRICGLMGMASLTEDTAQIDREFGALQALYERIKAHYFADAPYFNTLSMGMSGDYRIAIRHGSTLVRIGTSIFGERNYE